MSVIWVAQHVFVSVSLFALLAPSVRCDSRGRVGARSLWWPGFYAAGLVLTWAFGDRLAVLTEGLFLGPVSYLLVDGTVALCGCVLLWLFRWRILRSTGKASAARLSSRARFSEESR